MGGAGGIQGIGEIPAPDAGISLGEHQGRILAAVDAAGGTGERVGRRERWARRVVGVVIACDLAVGLTGIVLGPGLYLFIRPFVYAGSGILAAFALAIGLGSAGMLWAGLASWRALRAEPARLPRALALGAGVSLVAAFPGIGWGIWLGRYIADGRATWGSEVLAAEATAVLGLPLLPALVGLVAWSRCRRAAEWAVPGRASHWPARVVWSLAALVLLAAWQWPGGRPGPQTDETFEGRTPSEWLRRLGTDEQAEAALARAGPVAVPDLLAAIDSRRGMRWDVAVWFAELAAYGGSVAPLLMRVAIDYPYENVAACAARRHGAAVSPLVAVLLGRLGESSSHVETLTMGALNGMSGAFPAAIHAASRDGLRATNPRRRVLAAWACHRLGASAAAPEEIVAILVRALGDPDPGVRTTAARALGEMGSGARSAVPALLERLADPHHQVPWPSHLALVSIGQSCPEVGTLCEELLGSSRAPDLVLRVLCALHLAPPGVLQRLEARLRAPGKAAPQPVLQMVAALGPAGAVLLPVVEPYLTHARSEVQVSAAVACLALGEPTDARLAPLRAGLRARGWWGTFAIVEALWEHPAWVAHCEAELRGAIAGTDQRLAAESAGLLLRAGLDTGEAHAFIERGLRGSRVTSLPGLVAAAACKRCGPNARALLPALHAYRDGAGAFWPETYDAIDAVEGRTRGR